MKENASVLIVTGERELTRSIEVHLQNRHYRVRAFSNYDDLAELLGAEAYDVLIVDREALPEKTWEGFFQIRLLAPESLLLALCDGEAAGSLSEAYRHGVSECIVRPFHPVQVALLLDHLAERESLRTQQRELRRLTEQRVFLESLTGGAPPMRSLYQLIEEVAPSDIPILVVGEPGTEKLETARTIHRRSALRDRHVVELNLEANPPEVTESVLIPGDGRKSLPSPLEEAQGGTLLIHEIGRLPESDQALLLSALNGGIVPLGKKREARLSPSRLIATSTDDLLKLTSEGAFHRDLYYRINIVQIMIPPLRERLEDLPILAQRFLNRANKKLGTRVERISLDALLAMSSYEWPGNRHELEEAILAAARNGERGVMTRQHLPIHVFQAAAVAEEADRLANSAFREAKSRFEIKYFTELLRKTAGNMTHAAELSKVGRPYLYKKLQEYNLRPADFRRKAREGERRGKGADGGAEKPAARQ